MPGKYTDGYTKNAQKQKFVRNRDIKMKDSEVRKEAKIQKLMCEGVCDRCREKVQWRFRYDKYKPLKNPATCQDCHQKTVIKAYRTLCDGCATKRKVCPGCCADMSEEGKEEETAGANATAVAAAAAATSESESAAIEDENGVVWGEVVEDGEVKAVAIEEDEDEDEDGMEEDGEEGEEELGEVEERDLGMDLAWNEKKFHNIAASKYSKARVTGQEQTYH